MTNQILGLCVHVFSQSETYLCVQGVRPTKKKIVGLEGGGAKFLVNVADCDPLVGLGQVTGKVVVARIFTPRNSEMAGRALIAIQKAL